MAIKQITSLVNIGGSVTQTVANAFTQAAIGINLSPVDRQVFVITDVAFTSSEPSMVPATQSTVSMQVTKTSQTQLLEANNPDLISRNQKHVFGGVAEFSALETDFGGGGQTSTGGRNDYLMILATEDAFISVVGVANLVISAAQCRITGYFATADASTYQALVLSELQS